MPTLGRRPIKNYIRRIDKNATFLFHLTQHKVTRFYLSLCFQTEHQTNLKSHNQTCAYANQELYSKNRNECNLSVSAHTAQSNPFLLVTLFPERTPNQSEKSYPDLDVRQSRIIFEEWIRMQPFCFSSHGTK
jgi:hypothetical protein